MQLFWSSYSLAMSSQECSSLEGIWDVEAVSRRDALMCVEECGGIVALSTISWQDSDIHVLYPYMDRIWTYNSLAGKLHLPDIFWVC